MSNSIGGRMAVPPVYVGSDDEDPLDDERVTAADLTEEDVDMLMERTELTEDEALELLMSSVEA